MCDNITSNLLCIGQRKHLVPPIVEITRESTEENIGGAVTVLLAETARDSGISCGTRVDDQEKAMYIHHINWPRMFIAAHVVLL